MDVYGGLTGTMGGDKARTPLAMTLTPEVHEFIGSAAVFASEPMHHLLLQVRKSGHDQRTVLITGESGVGKEVVARAIHHYSLRGSNSWVDVNCAALPENLLESELFGYEKGAFSGADSSKPGLFEMAHRGTLFLDEIGDLDLRMQVKLLRVLDGVSYYRVGGVKKVSVDVRLVAATNQDLKDGGCRGTLPVRSLSPSLADPPGGATFARTARRYSSPGGTLSEAADARLRTFRRR